MCAMVGRGIAVRHGSVVAHCKTIETATALVLSLSGGDAPPAAICSGGVAAVSTAIVSLALELQNLAAVAFPQARVASLRDAAFQLRRADAGAGTSMHKRLMQLNAAASLLRHYDIVWGENLKKDFLAALQQAQVA